MRFKKIYIEITNICNFNCSFCYKSARSNRFMSTNEFQIVVDKISNFTDYIYLHVLGEPLSHPHINEILTIAENAGLNINITTNGGLISTKKNILLQHSIRQLNISLHDAEENILEDKWLNYLDEAIDFANIAAPQTYISFRLWNNSNASSVKFNSIVLSHLAKRYNFNDEYILESGSGNGFKLADHIFLQQSPRFEWPNELRKGIHKTKICYALRDHIAVLANGDIVPCCMDADATMKLGNIFSDNLSEILKTEKAEKIKIGFQNHKIIEPICSSCGFKVD